MEKSKEHRNILTAKHHKANKSDNIFNKTEIKYIITDSLLPSYSV